MKTGRGKDSGRGSGRLFRVLLACSLLLCLALPQLAAWPMQQGSVKAEEGAMPSIATSAPEAQGESQKTVSGTTPESTSEEQSGYLADQETIEKAAEGKRLSGEEAAALYDELVTIEGNMTALREMSRRKDDVIGALAAENASMKDETGTKAYAILDAIVGFRDGMIPEYGLGLTLGTRLGNSLMLQLGMDYMLGTDIPDIMKAGPERMQFRAGIGWMF